ncbi:FkbM family methyltransferase [Nocardioides sp. BYT-33-1]|jgi:FkbM family methyltransferase|uniref:FkbM family methyltransferase n=1 Tax=Nocardioides sp. BYT-33-1 TaxID=3416952 RepID=UPI003F5386F9
MEQNLGRQLTSRALRSAIQVVADRGFVVRRHPAVRLQTQLAAREVDLVFDVGAAKGTYGAELRHFGYGGPIVSCEPMSAPYAVLSAAAAADPHWHTVQVGLGAENGTADIHVASNSDSSSFLPMGERHAAAAPHVGYVGTETVRVSRLDDLVGELPVRGERIFLKVDTQGFERQVLDGAARTLDRCVGVQLELSFTTTYEGGMLVDEAITRMYDAGFVLTGLEPGFAAASGAVLQADGVFFRES